MNWLQQNAQVLSALASTGMMLIWVVYAWLFYQEFRRQRGSDLVIHEAGGGEPESVCVLVNLSREPVHVLCSLAARNDTTIVLRDTSGRQDLSAVQKERQGPLKAGESMPLGSFDQIRDALGPAPADHDESAEMIEIRVAAIHGFHERPIGARRRFHLDGPELRVVPATAGTEQLRSRRQCREVQRWVAQVSRNMSTDGVGSRR